ncbi:hypothetical protein OROMI_030546 [Orobanche minor]
MFLQLVVEIATSMSHHVKPIVTLLVKWEGGKFGGRMRLGESFSRFGSSR